MSFGHNKKMVCFQVEIWKNTYRTKEAIWEFDGPTAQVRFEDNIADALK